MGRIEPSTVLLADRGPCLLRSATPDDAPAVLDYRRALIGSYEFEINLPEEFEDDPEKQRAVIREALDKDNWVYIIAVAPPDGRQVLGGLIFRGQPRRRMRHHGTFGVAVAGGWRGRGVGRAMIRALLDWAADHEFLEKVCLYCFETNVRARALYRSLGFVEEGRSPRHFRYGPGQYVDDISMTIYVKPGVAPPGFNTWARGGGIAASTGT